MLKEQFFILCMTSLFLSACSKQPSTESSNESLKAPLLCSDASLIADSERFLRDLLAGKSESALSYYDKESRNKGEGFGIDYTFFPMNDPSALFDIQQKNTDSQIFVEVLGAYNEHKLVGFFQEFARGKTNTIEYLSENHWKSFVVCSFECIDGNWKISGQTCFEDSGSPFE